MSVSGTTQSRSGARWKPVFWYSPWALTTGLTWESAHGLYQKTGFQRAPERDWIVPDTDIRLLVYRQEL